MQIKLHYKTFSFCKLITVKSLTRKKIHDTLEFVKIERLT